MIASHRVTGLAIAVALGACCVAEIATQRPASPRSVAVTFDDLPEVAAGPGADAPEYVTESILTALRGHGVPAIGFVNEGQLASE